VTYEGCGSSGYGRFDGAVLHRCDQIGFKQQETWQAKDEVVDLPDGNSRVDVPPMAISVNRTG
jgi:hypothetical protein